MKKLLCLGFLAFSAMTFNAKAINLELALLIDGSGSISASEFSLQRSGYTSGLLVLPTDGSVAVGVWQFAGSTIQSVFTTTIIDSVATRTNLINAIAGMSQLGGGTPLGAAITTASNALLGNSIVSDRQLIDVSTDGVASDDAVAARNAALAAGIEQINGLLVGPSTNNSFVGGVGSFAIAVPDFAAFGPAIQTKLLRETGQTGVPDSGNTFALMSLGLFGLIAVRRMRAA